MKVRIDADGTVHLGPRVLPVPGTVSPAAQQFLAMAPWGGQEPAHGPMWHQRAAADAALQQLGQAMLEHYAVTVEEQAVGGVRTFIVRPKDAAANGRVLVNLHGGGFVMGSGSLVEAIPMADMLKTTVLAVDYRLAPEHRYPAAVDDAVAVYRQALAYHKAEDIAIYGSSAGAILTAQTTVRLEREGLPLPACLGMFTGAADLTDFGESARIYTLSGFWGELVLPLDHADSEIRAYLGDADRTDPLVSPIHADLSRFPPSLLMTGTRDTLLSATTTFHRALRRAGAAADLFVFEAMPHAHWYGFHLPEAQEALDVMAGFFRRHLRL
jgi:acetyl esterase/lipase